MSVTREAAVPPVGMGSGHKVVAVRVSITFYRNDTSIVTQDNCLTSTNLVSLTFFVVMPYDNIPDVPNGKRSPPEASVTCGAKVSYTCNEGFTLEGDSVLQCGTGGKMQGQVPVCREPGNLFMLSTITVKYRTTKLIP